MVQGVWHEIPAHYPGIDIDEFIVMPDHVHGIIMIKDLGDLGLRRPQGDAATRDEGDPEDEDNSKDRDDSEDIKRAPQSCYGTAPVPSPAKDREDLERRPQGDAATGDRGDSEDWKDSRDQANPEDAATGQPPCWPFPEESENPAGEPKENQLSLPDIMHRFKTMTTKRYTDGVKQHGWPPFPGKLWLRSYWERIIRDEEALQRVRAYIRNNPAKWKG